MREAGARRHWSPPPEGSWGSSPTATCATGSWLKAWVGRRWPSQRHSRHALWIRCCRWVRHPRDASRGIHHLPVLTPEGEPLGMVEDIDLLNAQSHTRFTCAEPSPAHRIPSNLRNCQTRSGWQP